MSAAAVQEQSRRDGEEGGGRRVAKDMNVIEDVAHSVANDVNALVQAWSEANAEIVKGVVSVIGNLVIDVNESVAQMGLREPLRRASEHRRGKRGEGRDEDEDVDDVGHGATRLGHSVSAALHDTASVIQRSSQRFQRKYDAVSKGENGDDEAEDVVKVKEPSERTKPPGKPTP